jgi:hypothetical protein
MTVPIQQYNDSLPDDLKAQVLTQNTDALNKISIGRGVNILKNLDYTALKSYGGGSFALIDTPFRFSISSSGGTVEVNCALMITCSGYDSAVALLIDGVTKAQVRFTSSGASLRWVGALSAGSHTVEIDWASTSGININASGFGAAHSVIHVVEYLI